MTEKQKGESIILLQTVIWGFFPIITVLTYAKLTGLASLSWSIVVTTIFFGIISKEHTIDAGLMLLGNSHR
jgi:4-amino-4-deoxy-L-arabinose transferase-like glycosyltransferase